jgi:serine protease inhibitor
MRTFRTFSVFLQAIIIAFLCFSPAGVITARSAPEVVDLMRPFLYFVVDRETQSALLAGKVEDPSTPRIF